MLLLTMAIALACGPLTQELTRAAEQRACVATIVKVHGQVVYDFEFDEFGIQSRSARAVAPEWLRNLFGIDFYASVVHVHLSNTDLTDQQLEKLEGLSQLRVLYLNHTRVTDFGLKHLVAFTNIEGLSLDDTRITDGGMKDVSRLTKLRWLSLSRTKLTDSGLKHLQCLSQLYIVDLYGDNVTDGGAGVSEGTPELLGQTLVGSRVKPA